MIKLGIVGVGKIVKDQHLPAINNNEKLQLVATASRNGSVPGVPAYQSIEEMVEAVPELDAVALCMPPQHRFAAAKFALQNNLHTLLEKPPGATVCEVDYLAGLAEQQQRSLFATWHSRYAAAVTKARILLAGKKVESVQVSWKENVRKWHPGQEWIWQAGGLGVFDPGINGLSVLTAVVDQALFLEHCELTFPENKSAPIAAKMFITSSGGIPINLEFDWRVEGDEEWSVSVATATGSMLLNEGGASLTVDGAAIEVQDRNEYEAIYEHFVSLIDENQSDVDLTPLKLVADAFMLGERRIVEPFIEHD